MYLREWQQSSDALAKLAYTLNDNAIWHDKVPCCIYQIKKLGFYFYLIDSLVCLVKQKTQKNTLQRSIMNMFFIITYKDFHLDHNGSTKYIKGETKADWKELSRRRIESMHLELVPGVMKTYTQLKHNDSI